MTEPSRVRTEEVDYIYVRWCAVCETYRNENMMNEKVAVHNRKDKCYDAILVCDFCVGRFRRESGQLGFINHTEQSRNGRAS